MESRWSACTCIILERNRNSEKERTFLSLSPFLTILPFQLSPRNLSQLTVLVTFLYIFDSKSGSQVLFWHRCGVYLSHSKPTQRNHPHMATPSAATEHIHYQGLLFHFFFNISKPARSSVINLGKKSLLACKVSRIIFHLGKWVINEA